MTDQGARVLIRCGWLFDGTGNAAVADAGILLHGDRIAAVGPLGEIESLSEAADAEVVDAAGQTVLPGLIDGHAHIAWSTKETEGWRAARADRDLLMAWAIASVQAALCAGITTIRDCGAPGGITIPLKRAATNGIITSPHLLVCGPAITTTAGHGEFNGVTADSTDELRQTIRALCRDGVDFIKIMATGGSMDPESNRFRAQYSVEVLTAAVEDAHRLRRPVVAHVNGTEGIRNAVAAGVDVVVHLNWLGIEEGTIDYDPAVVDEMLERGIYVDLNVEGGFRPLATGDGKAQDWSAPGAPQNRWELLAELRQKGIPIYFTSDHFGPGIADFPQLLLDAATQGNIPIEEVIWRATGLAAQGIGLGGETGTIAAGRRADLLIVDGDMTRDSRALLDVRAVYLAGKLTVNNGWVAPSLTETAGQQSAVPFGLSRGAADAMVTAHR
ncbi:MAG TPA: amidohydrolase family protein [Thermomicrobiales bacterium]|nr:amidohydrolase family protein [Thermomicrobiales bacterium]